MPRQVLFWFAWILISSATAHGGEIELRSEVTATNSIVTLEQIARVSDRDPDRESRLRRVQLLPAPAAGQSRVIPAAEVRRILTLQGVDVKRHQWSGAAKVVVRRPASLQSQVREASYQTPASGGSESPPKSSFAGRVEQAIVAYLRQRADSHAVWQVATTLDQRDLPRFARDFEDIQVYGGAAPWHGPQSFELVFSSLDGREYMRRIDVNVTQARMVPVARRGLQRGDRIRAEDVTLEVDNRYRNGQSINSLAEVIGLEVQSAISANQVIDVRQLKRPIIVKRRQPLTVLVRIPHGVVRMKTVAKQEAALDDVIEVVNPESKETLQARVVGPGVAEVLFNSRPQVRQR